MASVTIVSPAAGTVSGVVTVKVDAPGVQRVNFYVDGVLKGQDVAAPFAFAWHTTNYKDGPHTVKAVSGNGKLSNSRAFTVKNATAVAPSTVSNSLTAGVTLTGTYPWKVATAGDCASVEFWATSAAGNRKLATVAGGTPFTYQFNTSTLSDGTYTFGIVLVDSAGVRHEDSDRRSAVVQNGVPTPTPTPTPAPGTVKYNLACGDGTLSGFNEGGSHTELVAGATLTVRKDIPLVARSGYGIEAYLPALQPGGPRGRCQTYLNGHSNYGHEGNEDWYAFSFMFKAGSTFWDGGWNNLISWHNQDNANTNQTEGHWAFGGSNSAGFQLYLSIRGGKVPASSGPAEYHHDFTVTGNLVAGQRYDVVTHVKWSTDPNVGFIEAWVNNKRVVPLTKTATLFWRQDGSGPDAIYYKAGYDNGGQGPATVYEASHMIAADYAGAISEFPGGWNATPAA